MNYKKIHDSIIERAINRIPPLGYTEKHHIIPKSMGGTNDKSNLVVLTAEEHYVVHQLLAKIYKNNEMIYAARCMAVTKKDGHRVNNKLYGWLKKLYSKASSERQKGRKLSPEQVEKMSIRMKLADLSGDRNPFHGKTHTQEVRDRVRMARTGSTHSDDTKDKIRQSQTGIIHTEQCRRLISEKLKNNPKVTCPHCGKIGAKSPMIRHHFDNCKLKGVKDDI